MSGLLPRRCGWWGASLLLASVALGQVYTPYSYYYGYRQPYYGYGGYAYPRGYYHSGGGTAAGSYYSGLANAIRAQGQYNLMSSQAVVNLEEAKKRDIENREKWTKTYFEMRRVNEAFRHPKKEPPSPDTWVRQAHDAAPKRLGANFLDPVTGGITWPSLLQTEPFASDREKLEHLFAERASEQGAIGVEKYTSIRKAVDDTLANLKQRIRQYDSRSYLEARTFLTSLGYEASLPHSG